MVIDLDMADLPARQINQRAVKFTYPHCAAAMRVGVIF
jgi:hypothetical protein